MEITVQSELQITDFNFCGILGEGSFGRVMMATDNRTGDIVAVKVLRKNKLMQRGARGIQHAISEKQVLQELAGKRHPFIVGLLHSFQDELHLYLVMDFIGGGDLFQLIEQKERFPTDWARIYSAEICLALEHMHSQDIIYRDLKPENVMVAVSGHLKLTDFGFAKSMKGNMNTRGSCVGTPEYMAPELLLGKDYSFAVDWWTLGCLLYEMTVGVTPFSNDNLKELVGMITTKQATLPEYVPELCADVIVKLMCRDPAARLHGGVGENSLRGHAFYAQIDFEALARLELAAPYVPFQDDERGKQDSLARCKTPEAKRLTDEFGSTWSKQVGDPTPRRPPVPEEVHAQADALAERVRNPMMLEKSSNLALSLELTADGAIWRISNPLSVLFGNQRGMRHCLFGHPLLDPTNATPPYIEADSLVDITSAFERLLRQLQSGTVDHLPSPPRRPRALEVNDINLSGQHDSNIVRIRVHGRDLPIYLRFNVEQTNKLTMHSVALNPIIEGHAAVTVTFVDVTPEETAKQLVREKVHWTYNDRVDDETIAARLGEDFCCIEGTQHPQPNASASASSGIARYLDRRALWLRAFPDMRFHILELNPIVHSDGVRVVYSWYWMGTHSGPYFALIDGEYTEVAPTNQSVVARGIAVDEVRDGKIVEHSSYWDEAAVMQQLGPVEVAQNLLPPPGADELKAQAHMQRVHENRVLKLIALSCPGLGVAVCSVGDAREGSSSELCVRACSKGFAHMLGLDVPQVLGSELLKKLQLLLVLNEHPGGNSVIEELAQAVSDGLAAQATLVLHRGTGEADRTLLLGSFSPFADPFMHEGQSFFAVLFIDQAACNGCSSARLRSASVGSDAGGGVCEKFSWHRPFIDEKLWASDHATAESGHWASEHPAEESCDSLLAAALSCLGLSLVDMHTPDMSIVWTSQGFARMSGYVRANLIGQCLSLLHSEATDEEALEDVRHSIQESSPVCVTLWNVARSREGFWSCVLMQPGFNERGEVRYYLTTQMRLSTEQYRWQIRAKRALLQGGDVPVPRSKLYTEPRGFASDWPSPGLSSPAVRSNPNSLNSPSPDRPSP